MAEPDAKAPDADPDPPPAWRRRVARLLLVAGFAVGLLLLLPSVPHEQSLVFRLGDDPAGVRRIEATWTPAGDREALGGVTLSFDARAPARVRHSVSLPNGDYEVAVDVLREAEGGALSRTTTTRRVNLEGGETVIPLESR